MINNKWLAGLVAGVLLTLMAALPAQAESGQHSKMKACNAQAKGKKGDERKAFMKQCLSAPADAAKAEEVKPAAKAEEAKPAAKTEDAKPAAGEKKLTSQQLKMKECNANAKGMKGDERKKFMKECLTKKK